MELLKLLDSHEGTPVSRQDIFRNVRPKLPEGEQVNQKMPLTIGEFGYMLL